jgi:hypothetical protein
VRKARGKKRERQRGNVIKIIVFRQIYLIFFFPFLILKNPNSIADSLSLEIPIALSLSLFSLFLSLSLKLSTLLPLNRDPSIDPTISLCNEIYRPVSCLVSLSLSLSRSSSKFQFFDLLSLLFNLVNESQGFVFNFCFCFEFWISLFVDFDKLTSIVYVDLSCFCFFLVSIENCDLCERVLGFSSITHTHSMSGQEY